MLTYAELFAGAGGMSLGLEAAGWHCVAHAEIEPHARAVLRYRWPDTPLLGDVAQIDGRQFKGITMLTGGSPCQDLSIAGKRAGMQDGTRSSLFFEQVRIWRESEAPLMLWENVVGAFSSNHGRDFASVLESIVGSTVDVPTRGGKPGWSRAGRVSGVAGVAIWRTLDLQYFATPQRRRRVFVLGVRAGSVSARQLQALVDGLLGDSSAGGEAREGATPDAGRSVAGGSDALTFEPRYYTRDNKTAGAPSSVVTLTASVAKAGDAVPHVLTYDALAVNISNGVASMDDVMGTLGSRSGGQEVGNQTRGVVMTYDAGALAIDVYNQSVSADGVAHTIRAMNSGEGIPHVLTYDARGNGDGDVVNTLAGDHANRVTDYTPIVTGVGVPRRLMPVECERLMGWPEEEKSAILVVCSDHQKNDALAAQKSPRLPSVAGSVESGKSPTLALLAARCLRQGAAAIAAPVLWRVEIHCETLRATIVNTQSGWRCDAKSADQLAGFDHLVQDARIALWPANSLDIAAQETLRGREDEAQSEMRSMAVQLGSECAIVFGQEITGSASGAENVPSEERFTISAAMQSFQSCDLSFQTLCYSVARAISGLTHAETPAESSFAFEVTIRRGHTSTGIDEKGREYALKDTPRYKLCGNGAGAPKLAWLGWQIRMAIESAGTGS